MSQKSGFEKKDTLVVKGLAILLLLFYHLFENAAMLEQLNVVYAPIPQDIFLMLSGYGNICVAIFVFLTAYGITKGLPAAVEKTYFSDAMQQAFRRFCRLVGNFVIMYLSVNLVWHSWFDYQKLYGKGMQGGILALIDLFGFAQFLGTPTLNMTWWYMELAILFIFLVPLLYPVVKKTGAYSLMLGFLLPMAVTMNSDVQRYFLVALLGVAAAEEKWLEKLFAWKAHPAVKAIVGVLLIAISIPLRQNYMVHTYFLWILDGPIALLLCWFGGEVLSRIPGVSHLLAFFGHYSMNIFFVHTFFYLAIHRDWFYSFRYAVLIWLMLAVVSLGYSVALELVKKGGLILRRKCTPKRK